MRIALHAVKKDPEVKAYLTAGDLHLAAQGYTDHGVRHADLVSNIAFNVLHQLERPAREAELASIAAYLHDIGNAVSRHGHGQVGAVLAASILRRLGMDPEEVAVVAGAIGNHDPEDISRPVSAVSAAVILADKTDVHRSRVRNRDLAAFDTHDRVNYAVTRSFLRVEKDRRITLELEIDSEVSSLLDYLELFLNRMMMCRHSARFLGSEFDIMIDGHRL